MKTTTYEYYDRIGFDLSKTFWENVLKLTGDKEAVRISGRQAAQIHLKERRSCRQYMAATDVVYELLKTKWELEENEDPDGSVYLRFYRKNRISGVTTIRIFKPNANSALYPPVWHPDWSYDSGPLSSVDELIAYFQSGGMGAKWILRLRELRKRK